MKTTRIFMTLLIAVLLSLGFSVTSFASIAGSSHDLSTFNPAMSDEICAFCHTPHFKGTTLTYPLWSATVQTSATFTPYSSPTFDGAASLLAAGNDPLIGPSRLCMSCHDGTIGIDSAFGGNSLIPAGARVGSGGDLSSDHPIGFDYTAVAGGGGTGLDAEIREQTTSYAGGFISDYLFEGTIMTCASCHDVHEENGLDGKFLLVDNAGSALCLGCHIK